MRKMLLVLCGTLLLGWGNIQPANAKPSDAEIQAAADRLILFLAVQIESEADAIALFRQVDRNGNGEITFAEFKKALKQLGFGVKSSILKPIFLTIEVEFGNGNKKLTEAEYLDAVVALNL